MRLSRAETIRIIWEAAKDFPTGHDTLKDVVHTLCSWAVFVDDALLRVQKDLAQNYQEANSRNHELALRVANLETLIHTQQLPIRDSARLVELCRALEDLIIRFRP